MRTRKASSSRSAKSAKSRRQPVTDELPPELAASLHALRDDTWAAVHATTAGEGPWPGRLLRSSAQADNWERKYPNIEEMEQAAPRLWDEQRRSTSKKRLELEAKLKQARALFEAGNLAALADAIVNTEYRDGCLFGPGSFHRDHWIGVPRWVFDAVRVLAFDALREARVQRRGRLAKWAARWEQDQIDLARWRVVCELRAQGVPFTDGQVYERGARTLSSFGLAASSAAVKRSYELVQRRIKTQPHRYWTPEYVGLVIRPD